MSSGEGSRPPAVQRSNEEQIEQPKKDAGGIDDAWFMPEGKVLRGSYGGALVRKDLGTFAQSGVNVPGTLTFNRVDQIVAGGDFRVAFYEDGTMKAKWLVLDYTPIFSSNVAFCYEGKFTWMEAGDLEAKELSLVNRPSTFLKFKNRMTKMRNRGVYNKDMDEFIAQVETFNPQENRWDITGKTTRLARAARRKSYMYGTVKTPGYTLESSHEDA